MSYVQIGKKMKNKSIIISIVLNLIAVTAIFLFFEPTMKSDDYDMCNLLYGGVTGQYESQLLYSSILWGRLLVGLLKIFPSVAWYAVLQYILIVFSMICVDSILLKRNEKYAIPLFFLSCFLSYEFLIRLTFSKTSGLLMVAGYMVLLYALEQKKGFDFLTGFFLLFMGMIIRRSLNYFLLVTVIFFGAFIILCLKLKNRRSIVKHIILFGCVEMILLGLCWEINQYSNRYYEIDKDWKEYRVINTARSSVVDYQIPYYNTYKEAYQKLGISYNDYTMWFAIANMGDSHRLTVDMYKQIASMVDKLETKLELTEITRNLINYITDNTVSYVFFIVAFAMMIGMSKWNSLVLGIMLLDFLFCYGYMLISGRTQHHIDAVLMLGIVIILLYFGKIEPKNKREKLTTNLTVLVVMVIFFQNFSEQLNYSSYYGAQFPMFGLTQKEFYGKNYQDNSLMSEDKDHLYVTEAFDTNYTYPCFSPVEVFEKGFYSNIHRQNMNHIKIYENEVRKYGVDNIYKDITNSGIIYYVTSNYTDNNKNIMLKYIQENYNPNAKIQLVKKLGMLNIYQFYDEEYDYPEGEAQSIDANFNVKVETGIQDGKLIVSGYAFQRDTNSYQQKVYVKLTNINDESVKWYMTTQVQNMETAGEDLKENLYSGFKRTINLEDDEINSYDINVYLENQNGLFALN